MSCPRRCSCPGRGSATPGPDSPPTRGVRRGAGAGAGAAEPVLAVGTRPGDELVVAAAASIDGTAPGDPTVPAARRRLRRLLRRAWPTLRIIFGFALAVFVAVGALVQDLRAPGLPHRLPALQLVVGGAGRHRRDRVLLLLRRHAVRAPQGGPPPGALVAAGQADLRLAGHHQLAADRQRGVVGLRLPLVPPLRRRQHPGRLGPGRDPGGGDRQPVARRHPRAGRGGAGGSIAGPGPRPHRDLRGHRRHRVALRLRAPAPCRVVLGGEGCRSPSPAGPGATPWPSSTASPPG